MPEADRPARPRPGAPALILTVGLSAAIALALLTPPLQAPDEQQHFDRAYQVSTGHFRTFRQGDGSGAVLPSSLPDMAEHFLGARGPNARLSRPHATLREDWAYAAVPLDPARQEFVDYRLSVLYPPWAYAPQALAMALARGQGAGPLWLLIAGRLGSAIASVLLVALAARLTPIAKTGFAVAGLLPMALFTDGSVAVDGVLIGTAFVLTAIAHRVRARRSWTWPDFLGAVAAGLFCCVTKPVYMPLLLLPLPVCIMGRHRASALRFQAGLVAIVVAVWLAWASVSAASFALPWPFVDPSAQLAFAVAHPGSAIAAVCRGLYEPSNLLYDSFIGILGWLSVWLPPFAYDVPQVALALGAVADSAAPRQSAGWAIWDAALVLGSIMLISASMYFYWSRVGATMAEGIQGRYFLPLSAAAAAALYIPVRWRVGPVARSWAEWGAFASIVVVAVATVQAVIVTYFIQ